MEKDILEKLKSMNREERKAYFEANKSELLDDALESVSGGHDEMPEEYRNPNSDVPDYFGNWLSSWNFICRGQEICK